VFIRDVFYTFSTEIFAVAMNFAVGVLLARALSPAGRGIMVLVMTFPWTVASFANLGYPQANIYLLGRKKYDARAILGNSLVAVAILGMLSVIVLSAMKEALLRTALRGLPAEYWFLLMLLVFAFLVDVMLLSILRARQRFDLFNLRRLVTPILMLVGFVIALALSNGGLSAAVRAYTVVTVLTAILSLVLTGREVPLTLTFNRRLADDSLRFGLKSYLQNLVGAINYRLDVYLLAFFLTPEQVAFYGVATSLAEVVWYIPNSVGMVLFPRLSNAPMEEIHQITAKVCRNTLAGTGIIVAGLLAVGWLFVPLVYGPVYRAAVLPLLILLPGVISMAIYKVLTRNFTSRNRQQIPILASGMALTLNLGLDWVLIPRWGIAGAAIASTVGYTAAGVVLLASFLHDSRLSWQETLLPVWQELVGHWYWAKAGFSRKRQRIERG
jgi:O-antigen/teichoic acid export membrane protein